MSEAKACKSMVGSGTEQSLFEDEVLEAVWEMRERTGAIDAVELKKEFGTGSGEERLAKMRTGGLIIIQGDKALLTEEGERRSRDITRRHRLAERLFTDVLDLKEYEEEACRFEHAISSEVEEAICTLLGHPPVCPHGKNIPRGRCCEHYTQKLKPLTQSLRDLEVGKRAKVQFIAATGMDRLASIGLVPGAYVRLVQKRPSYVLDIEETTIAIDEEIARGVFVKRT